MIQSIENRSEKVDFVILWNFLELQVNGLPFNRYTWLTTHNSFAVSGTKSPSGGMLLGPANQEDSVTSQLQVSKNEFSLSIILKIQYP